jgi:two-component system sensor histidine kinase CpxA
MRKLYWKIFLSFWLATILIILTIAWVTSEIAQKSSGPISERLFMDSYANAAVATYESGERAALIKWLKQTGLSRQMNLYLLNSKGEILGDSAPPEVIKKISNNLLEGNLDEDVSKFGHLLISHEILSTSGTVYRLVAISERPLEHFVHIPWAGLTIRLLIAIFISGLICYLLSIYFTQPLEALGRAARLIAKGKLSTRVGQIAGHHNDELTELSFEFDSMAEKLETLMLSKERLLQDISHELRSPLARLQVAIELGRQKTQGGAAQEFQRMELECLRLNNLISEILDYARLDKSTNTTQKTLVDMPNLIRQTINDANFEFSPLVPRVSAGEIHPCELMVDQRLIHRAIENIIRNALSYSPVDSKVIISCYCMNEHNQVLIDIEDEGPGVPEEQLSKIFNPFYRVDTSREKNTGGYGLGLAIARQAIKLHHGEILAKNRAHGGLHVRIILPIQTRN